MKTFLKALLFAVLWMSLIVGPVKIFQMLVRTWCEVRHIAETFK